MIDYENTKSNADIIEDTYFEYHGKYDEGSEKEKYFGFYIIDETEATA